MCPAPSARRSRRRAPAFFFAVDAFDDEPEPVVGEETADITRRNMPAGMRQPLRQDRHIDLHETRNRPAPWRRNSYPNRSDPKSQTGIRGPMRAHPRCSAARNARISDCANVRINCRAVAGRATKIFCIVRVNSGSISASPDVRENTVPAFPRLDKRSATMALRSIRAASNSGEKTPPCNDVFHRPSPDPASEGRAI